MKGLFLIILLTTFSITSFSALVDKDVYIVRDSLELVSGEKAPYITFNSSTLFSETNIRIDINAGDDLNLWVFNTDSLTHEFQIKGITSVMTIPALDSVNLNQTFSTPGAYIFYDPLNFPNNSYLGLSGMITVKDHNHSSFYWNIKDHKNSWNTDIANNTTVDWNNYYPNYFTINGKSNPDINLDSDARITGSVADTLMIYISNTGQSIHSMHFHGYHVEVIFSSRNPNHVGRMKDSQGIYPCESVVLRLVPDKPGEYPVHDHNLVATTGGNIYPLGMFTTILILP